MLPIFDLITLAVLILQTSSTAGHVASSINRRQIDLHGDSSHGSPESSQASPVHRRQLQATNHTVPGNPLGEEELEITCFRSSRGLILRPVRIPDCAKIIEDLSQMTNPDVDRVWGTIGTKSPDIIVPHSLPPHRSCIGKVNPWPPENQFAWAKFSPNYLGFVVKEVILKCLTGVEPYGGTTLFGPDQQMRLILSGPLPVSAIGGDDTGQAGIISKNVTGNLVAAL